MNNLISVQKIFDAKTVVKDTSELSAAIDRNSFEGKFSLQLAVSGDGTVSVGISSQQRRAGRFEDRKACKRARDGSYQNERERKRREGDDLVFEPGASRYIKIRVTETGASQDAAVKGWLGFIEFIFGNRASLNLLIISA